MRRSHALAIAVAQRLDAVAPDGISVWTEDGELVFGVGDQGISWMPLAEAVEESRRRSIETTIVSALDELQDIVIENVVKGGWPRADPSRQDRKDTGPELPHPGARAGDDEIRFWYGWEDAPALVFEPIKVEELERIESASGPG